MNVDREASRIGLGLTAAASLLAALVAAPGSVGLSLVGVPSPSAASTGSPDGCSASASRRCSSASSSRA
ncbi:hypothetical protein [Halapricum sp. CBA1109]|uniref:hypothetical protein n=1 Tax=Halapricum sp. CBA1109 TaxID=2668068 RepID=UPI0018D2528B|nr:hypothetical protein [Halapricum sp. CBA1109]